MIQNITIVILSVTCVSLILKFMGIPYYNKYKKLRETQAMKGREEVIKKIVREYLEELKND